MNTRILHDDYLLVKGAADYEAGMTGLTSYPASGAFVNVSAHPVVHIICHFGTINASDTPVLEPKCSDAINGTLDQIDSSLIHTCNVTDDDGQFVTWTIETKKLPANHYFLAVALSGVLTNGSYADIVFVLPGLSLPVAAGTDHPDAHKYTWVG